MFSPDRYSRMGLAHSAADTKSETTGEPWVAVFDPRPGRGQRIDPTPFTIMRSGEKRKKDEAQRS